MVRLLGARKRKRSGISAQDQVFYAIIYAVLALVVVIVGYPLLIIVSSSFSSTTAVTSGRVVFLPVEFSLDGYRAVFENRDVFIGYRNSLLYAVLGTAINLFITALAAYPLSRKDLPVRSLLNFIFTFTMIFSGGMIPTYIVVASLGMLNSIWAMLIPGALSVYNMILMRSFFQNSLPGELLEAAHIDGCTDFRFFLRIAIPLSKPVIAVVALYYAIGHWNSYFRAFLYLTKKELYPLQVFLREILLANTIDPSILLDEDALAAKQGLSNLMKYSLIVVATVPVLIVYPFVQKQFVKGVMIGSVKG